MGSVFGSVGLHSIVRGALNAYPALQWAWLKPELPRLRGAPPWLKIAIRQEAGSG